MRHVCRLARKAAEAAVSTLKTKWRATRPEHFVPACGVASEGGARHESDIRVGNIIRRSGCSFSEQDVAKFCQITGDTNSIHSHASQYPASIDVRSKSLEKGERGVVVNGALVSSLIPAVVGSIFPGSLYVSEHVRFRRLVLTGDILDVALEVLQLSGEGSRLKVHAKITRKSPQTISSSGIDANNTHFGEEEELVAEGEAVAILPTMEKRRSERTDDI